MEIGEFLRTFWFQLLIAIIIPATLIILYRVLKEAFWDEETRKAVRKVAWKAICIVTAVIWLIIGLNIVLSSSLNLFPRSAIDRSNLDQQDYNWEQQHSTPTIK